MTTYCINGTTKIKNEPISFLIWYDKKKIMYKKIKIH